MLIAIATILTQSYNPATASPPSALTASSFDTLKLHASPLPQDLSWQSIDWQNTVAKGINKARLEDKPIVMWLFFGDPRGSC